MSCCQEGRLKAKKRKRGRPKKSEERGEGSSASSSAKKPRKSHPLWTAPAAWYKDAVINCELCNDVMKGRRMRTHLIRCASLPTTLIESILH